MPELPDLLYIEEYLRSRLSGRTVERALLRQPVVLRNLTGTDLSASLSGTKLGAVSIHGPFLTLQFTGGWDLVFNLMLSGRLQHQEPNQKAEPFLSLSLELDDATRLNLCDQNKMAKAYLVHHGEYDKIPAFSAQGVDVRSQEFTCERFLVIARENRRKQVRVFINTHTILSSIGNAYADEILFDAGIHPKTFVSSLGEGDLTRLYWSILSVLRSGAERVREAQQPIHVKVRDHMKVRNRKGEPCPRCGTTIRREGVRGHDVYFCPRCQSATRSHFIDWKSLPPHR
jgi:formamidopyrimidine-DNA glycosylase